MRILWSVVIALFTVPTFASDGKDNAVTPDLGAMVGGQGWKVHNATPEAVTVDGKRAVRLTATGDSANGVVGLALADGVEFTTGVVEVDLKGQNVRGRSFVGVAFNVAGDREFEAIYFRPFNFKAEGEFKGRAVQYVAWPENTWEHLRKTRPGKFEAAIRPVPDPDKWFHARIDVGEKQVQVFVNGAKEPCLTVDRLSEGKKGRPTGLFVDSADGLYANLKVAPAK